MNRHFLALFIIGVTAVTAGIAAAAEAGASPGWPQFLGPYRDGISRETVPLAASWPQGGPPVLWSFALEDGFGGAAVLGDEVFVADREASMSNVLYCLDLATGAKKWRVAFEAKGKQPSHPGTRCTPAVDEKRVYFIDPFATVYCIDRATHRLAWSTNLVTAFACEIPKWECGQSPLLFKDMLILAPSGKKGGIVALKKATGEVAWKSQDIGGQTHSSPMAVRIGNSVQIVTIALGGISGVDAADGTLLWSWPWNGVKPIPNPAYCGGGRFFLVEGYGAGCAMICVTNDASGAFTVTNIFSNTLCHGQIPTPIYHDGYIYTSGNSNKQNDGFMCLDQTGAVKWKTGRKPWFERGNFLMAGGMIYHLDGASGVLRLIKPDPDAYTQLAEAPVTKGGQAWAPLAITSGKLLVRGKNDLTCLDVRAKQN